MLFEKEIEKFKETNSCDKEFEDRISPPQFPYFGRDVMDQAIAAILAGKNLLLVGEKATGKNVLAENLAYLFKRPVWNISFHINIDAYSLIGSDSLKAGNVVFRKGPVYLCAKAGGFGILDEINMARNEALAVLHAVLDHRRIIDVPGYDRIRLNPACRFIATMNYGYAGTRELNRALLSRFVVIRMPMISQENLDRLLEHEYPALKKEFRQQFTLLFMDLLRKADAGEIGREGPDLRGLLDSLALAKKGLVLSKALDMGLVNKLIDPFEVNLVRDSMNTRFRDDIGGEEIFEK